MSKKKSTAKQKPTDAKSKAIVRRRPSPVDTDKKQRLDELKRRIHRLTDNFIQVVIDLQEIRKEDLWKFEVDKDGNQIYGTFESFMDAEFGFRRAYYSRLNKAADAYKWLGENDSTLQKRVTQTRPAFYEALGKLPEGDRIETLKTLLDDKTQKQKGASLVRIWRNNHDGQSLPVETKEKSLERQLQIAFGILSKISVEDLDGNGLLESLLTENENLKEVIRLINGKIKKAR